MQKKAGTSLDFKGTEDHVSSSKGTWEGVVTSEAKEMAQDSKKVFEMQRILKLES